ncbi:MAG: hypothetical protein ACETWC_09355 [Acidobacteriota bacterium]
MIEFSTFFMDGNPREKIFVIKGGRVLTICFLAMEKGKYEEFIQKEEANESPYN